MQELRLVAVSEDGTYLVLASPVRGTRFSLPIDGRLRAAVSGHVSRLGQLQIEVESPLRPKEIQARIRAGETADDIAEAAGIPIDRVRWFEGPVLQEREFMAQEAQRTSIRRPGDTTSGPLLGEIVADRLRTRGVDADNADWDSWKREDGTWKIRLHYQVATRPHSAEWIFDPARRHVSPVDEEASRLSFPDDLAGETVTPFVPRIAAAPPAEPETPSEPDPTPEPQQAKEEPAEPAPPPADAEPQQRKRRAAGGRGRRASVPSWDEIMFSTHRRRD
ncbi:MAG: septation protein SepH [Streptosporangiaceae bacterium]